MTIEIPGLIVAPCAQPHPSNVFYEHQTTTGKVHDDARHLLVAIAPTLEKTVRKIASDWIYKLSGLHNAAEND